MVQEFVCTATVGLHLVATFSASSHMPLGRPHVALNPNLMPLSLPSLSHPLSLSLNLAYASSPVANKHERGGMQLVIDPNKFPCRRWELDYWNKWCQSYIHVHVFNQTTVKHKIISANT
jgi:hypothetical protein